MRKALVVSFVLAFLLIPAGMAYASGYNPDSEVTSTIPHGRFTTTSNRCKNCHAVHLATGSYRLLRNDSGETACQYCHGIGGISSKITRLDTEGHGLDTTQQASALVTAPDGAYLKEFQIAPDNWGCGACHSVHDNNTVYLWYASETTQSKTKLLKKFPNSESTVTAFYNPDNTTSTLAFSNWCTNCHGANYGIHTQPRTAAGNVTRYGHDVLNTGTVEATETVNSYPTQGYSGADIDPGDGINKGPRCRGCHTARGAQLYYGSQLTVFFPHVGGSIVGTTTGGAAMLRSGALETQLDFVCANYGCHKTTSLP